MGHESTHDPAVHTWPAPHDWPQRPQLSRSDMRFRQLPAQFVWSAGQLTAQWPAVHTWPTGHNVPHAPQLAGSMLTSRHAPVHSS